MSRRWAKRAELAASMLPHGLSIADIGCGAMDLERLAKPREYRPIDRWRWDERTRLIDLEAERLPAEWLAGCDVACLLGVFEYIANPGRILEALADAGCAVLFTYHPTDLTVADDTRSPIWKSNFSTSYLEAMLGKAGFQIAKKLSYETTQHVYLCHLTGRPPTWIVRPKPYDSVAPREKPTLVLAGFYGRGNCGDEALLQCACEAMQDDFDILISVDEHGAYPGYWDWYPYNKFDRTHQTNLGFFRRTEKYAGLLVGGGGLPYGFAANQAVHARSYQAATALAGVDFVSTNMDPRMRAAPQQTAHARALRQYADLFDFRALRTLDAVHSAKELGLDYFHGADWALRLPMDRDPSIEQDDRRVLIVLREWSLRSVSQEYVEEILLLISTLEERGWRPHFLPFAPEDERFIEQLGMQDRLPVVRTWWNARRAKQWIASSGLTLSVTRLHPLIFAAPTGARIASLVPRRIQPSNAPILGLESDGSKLANVCRELGIRQFYSTEEMLAGLDSIGPADPEKVALSTARLDAMIERLRRLFRESAASRAGVSTD